jgi:DNA polymerase III delta prime subunit
MIAKSFNSWRIADARLLRTDINQHSYRTVDVATAAQNARELLGIKAPDMNGFAIPLHDSEEPTPSNQYVVWRPETDSIGWFDTEFGVSGIERFASVEDVSNTIIAHRLRFWLSANQPDTDPDIEFDLPETMVSPTSTLSQDEQESFFADLTEFVSNEKTTAREKTWDAYVERGLEQAIRRNHVAGPFFYIGSEQKTNREEGLPFQLAQEDDDDDDDVDLCRDEGLFPGNLCIVDAAVETDAFPIPAKIQDINGEIIRCRPDWMRIEDRNIVETQLRRSDVDIWISDLLNPVPYERQLTAIQQVQRDSSKRDLITGTRPVEFRLNKYTVPEPAIELNEYQHKALAWADGATDVMCIHGPPGTGKTRTLTAYAQHAVSQGYSVLITAHSNQAVDNLIAGDSTVDTPEADTLHALAQDADSPVSIARVGSNTRNPVINKNYVNRSISRSNIVAATTSGAAQFDQDRFDIAIVDEATQASRPSTAIVLNCAKKLILAGDHKQLPPYCADETMQDEDLHISLFEHLLNRYGRNIAVLLQKQYRMNQAVAEFPNQAFYDGKLETATRNRDWHIDDLKPVIGIDIAGTEQRESNGHSIYNREETETVAKQVKLLSRAGVSPEDIGVITMYSGQKRTIKSAVNQLDIDDVGRVTVDTVDSFQGGEREAIIVSFVRSNEDGHSGFLEFPEEGPRRLNVALTRARKRLVLVGNWTTLGERAPHRSLNESCAHYYAELADHIRNTGKMLTARKQ